MAKIVKIPIDFLEVGLDHFSEVSSIIKSGGIIGFPTDTYYGLGADPFNSKAITNIFKVKNRSKNKPILILVSSLKQIDSLVEKVNQDAHDLMNAFWPGPLTLVFEAKTHLPHELTAGTGKVGIRFPDNPFVLRLIEAIKHPLTASSANPSGQNSPTTAKEVEKLLGKKIQLILDGGPTLGGQPSTVVDIEHTPPRLLRHGKISQKYIESIIKKRIV